MGLKKIPFGSALYVADKCDQIIEKIPLFLWTPPLYRVNPLWGLILHEVNPEGLTNFMSWLHMFDWMEITNWDWNVLSLIERCPSGRGVH
jgi:hypothetical protein